MFNLILVLSQQELLFPWFHRGLSSQSPLLFVFCLYLWSLRLRLFDVIEQGVNIYLQVMLPAIQRNRSFSQTLHNFVSARIKNFLNAWLGLHIRIHRPLKIVTIITKVQRRMT